MRDLSEFLSDEDKRKLKVTQVVPPSKHRAGRTKPLTKEQRKKRDRLLAKLEQAAKSAEVDKRALGG